MPITLLPNFTVRAIGSSLVLNDACSVIKELVDNALDARASSIVIEISSDTLAVLQVKDNGHGIGVEDRQLVCKRGCTSKIRTMEDLAKLGGSSLGFRGEALASVAELSEAITLTTRVDGEVVGTTLKIGRDGALQNSTSASHPVGTTIRIQGFLKSIPVRKEAAKKAASKTLVGIKKLLCNYAFARPSVRFAFKVLRANNEKANWSYSPNIGSTSLQDITTKIIGQEVAAQCELRSVDLQHTVPNSTREETYSVDAVLAMSDVDPSKIHNVGQYLSIDGRPVNPIRGIMKEIVKLYKSFYRAASGSADRSSSSTNPFLCMHIRCPQGSYDVNIEPAKDDVLFSEPSQVIGLAEELFRDYYGELASDKDIRTLPLAKRQAVMDSTEKFDVLLARKVSVAAQKAVSARQTDLTPLRADVTGLTHAVNAEPLANRLGQINVPTLEPEPSSMDQQDRSSPGDPHAEGEGNRRRPKPHFNMYGNDDDDNAPPAIDPSTPALTSLSKKPDDNEVESARVTNPWSLAKLHAPCRRSEAQSMVHADSEVAMQLMTPGCGLDASARNERRVSPWRDLKHANVTLPSPTASSPSPAAYQNPGPPLRRRAYNGQQSSDDDDIEFTQGMVSEASNARPANTLDTWVRPRKSTMHAPSLQRESVIRSGDGRSGATTKTRFQQRPDGLENPTSTQLTEPHESWAETLMPSNNMWKPFKSPFKGTGRTFVPSHETRHLVHNTSPACERPSVAVDHDSQSSLAPPPLPISQHPFKMSQTANAELAAILEFEDRKKAAVSRQRKSQPSRRHGELSPKKLAVDQRNRNGTPPVLGVSSQMRRSLPGPDLREEETNPANDFERRFAKASGEETQSVTHRNSPHRNRILAAKERLARAQPEDDHVLNTERANPSISDTKGLLSEAGIRLSENDPRSYIAQHVEKEKRGLGLTGSRKTSFRLHRTKTNNLPLETIPADAATCGLKAVAPVPWPNAPALATMSERQAQFDEYVRTGENGFARWSANSRDVAIWETTLKGLVAKSFEVRLAGGEAVAADVRLMLATVIKAHADAHGL